MAGLTIIVKEIVKNGVAKIQMTNSALAPLEFAVLRALLVGDSPVFHALRLQLDGLRVRSREFTGYGFFAELEIVPSAESAPVQESQIKIGGVEAEIEGLEDGAGFVLFVEHGFLSMLEGFSYDETWPQPPSDLPLIPLPGPQINGLEGEREGWD